MDDCIFCRIATGQIPSRKVHDDEQCVAFEDLNPQAPTHLLIIPRRHLAGLDAVAATDETLLGHLLVTASALAARFGLTSGYRVVLNTGPHGGQTVFHLHLHLLGGRSLAWPPG